ncbi:MAG: S-adenosylmethionine decarboxylase [Candidatus Odinarchaeota archaeon]
MSFSTKRFQLVMEVGGGDSVRLMSRSFVEALILKVADLSEMEVLHGPVIVEGRPHNPGLTGFVVIDYSHIAVHTFPSSGDLFLDLCSCKMFDATKIEDYVQRSLNVDKSMIKSTRLNLE